MSTASDSVELAELKRAFVQFTSVSKRMQESYERLKSRTEELKHELREKNERLVDSLRERQQLERFLEGILQNLPIGILVTDREGGVRLVNQKAMDILGRSEETIREAAYNAFEILQGMPLRVGASMEKKQGRSVYRCSVSPLKGEAEEDPGWVILMEDISDITRWKNLAERQKRLSSMGEMAARIAHEIRNPLGSMELNVAMLLEEVQGHEGHYTLACRLATGVRTVTQILANLLHFAKGTDPRWEPLDLAPLVEEALDFADPLLREKGIRVRMAPREVGSQILGDRVLLRQALLNLILNAVEAMKSGGVLHMDVVNQRESTGLWNSSPVTKILVQDTGKGIPDEDLDRIFDPFFSTKSRGTGLGLAIANNIVESHGGIIEVESRPHEGSCFVISLPSQQKGAHDGYAAHPCGG
jgi:signal transduction histidine kinase